MRTKKSLLNIIISCSSYLVLTIGAFIARALLLRWIGDGFGGIETTFLNVISMLAIVELGLGTGIVYKLYEPIANEDNEKIAILLNFLKRAYNIIIVIVSGVGIITAFFVPMLVKDDEGFSYWYLLFVFLLYLLDVICSYLFAHKRAMFVADQKNYTTVICHTIAMVIIYILQIIALYILNNLFGSKIAFVGYLALKVVSRLIENFSISILFDKKYSRINLKCKDKLPKTEKDSLFGNIRALLMHKIAGFTLKSVPSLFITKFIDLAASAIYGNYMLIFTGLTTLSDYVFGGITASFGNLLATSSREETVNKFNIIYFLNFLLYSFFTVAFFNISFPFIRLWVGPESVFPLSTTILISVYLYCYGTRQSVFMARSSAGQYRQDRWFAVLEAIINVVLSFVLVRNMGINGIFIANIVSFLLVPFWTQPRIVYNYVLKDKLSSYYIKYVIYFAVTAVSGVITYFICKFIPSDNVLIDVLLRMIVCIIVPNLINVLIFMKTKEFVYLKNTGLRLLKKLKNRRTETN